MSAPRASRDEVKDRPTITPIDLNGWDAFAIANGVLRATVLPGKGADIVTLTYLPTDTEILFSTPQGLRPPGSPPAEGSDGRAFLENYEGGWQALFPNTNPPTDLDGVTIPFHGEVAVVPWSFETHVGDDGASIELSVECGLVPARMSRTVRLPAGASALVVEERIEHTGDRPFPYAWGEHLVLGPPVVAAGARLELPATRFRTPSEPFEAAQVRLVPGQEGSWPFATTIDGGTVDLREIPGPETGSHDDVHVTGFSQGRARVANAALGLAVQLTWDHERFPWLISWEPYGGVIAPPVTGSYGLGVEPWTYGGNLAAAIAAGEAPVLLPGTEVATTFELSVERLPSTPGSSATESRAATSAS